MSELLKINVSGHTEKKNGLTYLSWVWAWAEVLKADPTARFEVRTFNGLPACYLPGDTASVCVEVVIKGLCRECWLPVMDHRNKSIKLPDSFAINTAIMRCMTKAVSLHGLGLNIYAGEDLPMIEDDSLAPVREASSAAAKTKKGGVIGDVLRDMPPLDKYQTDYMDELAAEVSDTFIKLGQTEAFERVEIENLDNDQKLHLWSRLDSKVRSALKTEKGLRIGAA